jgi:hypothetical protein
MSTPAQEQAGEIDLSLGDDLIMWAGDDDIKRFDICALARDLIETCADNDERKEIFLINAGKLLEAAQILEDAASGEQEGAAR